MNESIKWAMTVLIVTMVIGAMPTDAEGGIYDDTLKQRNLWNSFCPRSKEMPGYG